MKQGFKLIELLVVVLVIGILSAVALPQYQTAVERARATEALTQMSAIRSAAERFHSQRESWPTSFNQLDVDIPTSPVVANVDNCDPAFGSKNFCVTMASADARFTVTATRRRANHGYTLTTAVVANANGTYSATRSCTPIANDDDSIAYCNAIAGGNINDF